MIGQWLLILQFTLRDLFIAIGIGFGEIIENFIIRRVVCQKNKIQFFNFLLKKLLKMCSNPKFQIFRASY
jgi:hypothetical protein